MQSQQEAREAALQPLIDEQTYLQDVLQFGEDEARIRQRINEVMSQAPDLDRARVEEMVRGNAALEERVNAVAKLKEQYKQLASGIASEITGAFRSIIDGTKSVDEAFADMLKGIADKFLDMAMKILTDALTQQLMKLFGNLLGGFGGGFGGGGGGFGVTPLTSGMSFFADGGRPSVGEYSVVGERGPEFFKPDQPGRVISNEQSKAAMSRYSASNDTMRAQESSPIVANVNYNGPMLNFNGDEYIPRSEASSLVKAGAKQGEAMTLARLQNSRSSRAKLGL